MKFNKPLLLAIVFFVMCKALAAEPNQDMLIEDPEAKLKARIARVNQEFKFLKLSISNMGEYKVRNIVVTIEMLPDKQRFDIVNEAKSLITPDMTGYNTAETIDAVKRLPPTNRKKIVNSIASLFESHLDSNIKASIDSSAKRLPPANQAKVINLIASLFESQLNGNRKADIFLPLLKLPVDEIIPALYAIKPTIIPIMGTAETVLNSVKQLITQEIDRNEIDCIIDTISNLADNNEAKITLNAIKQFITPEMGIDKIISILETVLELPDISKADAVLSATKKFIITPKMGGREIVSIIETVLELPDISKAGAVLSAAKQLITPDAYSYQISYMIESIGNLPNFTNLETIINAIKQLITPDANSYQICYMIESIGNLPDFTNLGIIINVIKQLNATKVTQCRTNGYCVGKLIESTSLIPLNEFTLDNCKALLNLISLKFQNSVEIIKAIEQLPEGERLEVIRLTTPLHAPTPSYKCQIISTIGKLPINKRKAVTEKVKLHMEEKNIDIEDFYNYEREIIKAIHHYAQLITNTQ